MTDFPHKSRVAHAFGQARRYEDAADVQRAVAHTLANQIAAVTDSPFDSVLEIGSGTGFLTRAMMGAMHRPPSRWIVSDVAPAMVERAQENGPHDADYRVIDGESIDPAIGHFDLICSSLAFQWFADLPRAVATMQTLLNPGGMLAFATMARGSFDEWRSAHDAEGVLPGTPPYPDEHVFRALTPRGFRSAVEVIDVPQPEANALAFLKRLKAIGAGTPRADHVPLDAGALRRVMARFDAGDRIVTYRVAFCLFHAPRRR